MISHDLIQSLTILVVDSRTHFQKKQHTLTHTHAFFQSDTVFLAKLNIRMNLLKKIVVFIEIIQKNAKQTLKSRNQQKKVDELVESWIIMFILINPSTVD